MKSRQEKSGGVFSWKALLVGALLATSIAGVSVWYGLQSAPPLSIPIQKPAVPSGPSLKMLFLGTSSMAWTDGQSTWMVDGFFSRQPLSQVMFSRLNVEQDRVLDVATEVFQRLDVPEVLSAVVVAHSHYDHAMDAPFLVHRLGGQLAGSESTAQIARGQGLPEEQIRTIGREGHIRVGDFGIDMLASAHAPTGFTGGFNSRPLVLPAHALSFKEGISYTFLVSHPSQGAGPFALIQSSAGFVPGQNQGVSVNTVFLGAGGLGKLEPDYLANYWKEMVQDTGARQVYLIHWDNFTRPLLLGGQAQALEPMPRLVDDFARSLQALTAFAQRDGVDLKVLDAWDMVQF